MRSNAQRWRLFAIFGLALAGCASPRATAAEVRVEKDVEYGVAAETKLLLDAYIPVDSTVRHPGIVLVHGGGFVGGDKAFYAPYARHLASNGYVVFSLNYRLAPRNHYPAAVDDVQRAVRWLRAHAETYRLDPARIGAMGDSAGGYLVTMLGARETRDNSDAALAKFSSRVRCVVDLYGPTDFTAPPAASAASAQAIFLLTQFFGKTPEQAPEAYREGSPIVYIARDSAPFLILHGTADPLVPLKQSQQLFDALRGFGVKATLLELYGAAHGFFNPASPGPAGLLADDFLDRNLKAVPATASP